MVYCETADVAIMYGGFAGRHEDDYLSDTWVFRFQDNVWTNIEEDTVSQTSENHPMQRASHGMAVVKDGVDVENDVIECVFLMYGGIGRSRSSTNSPWKNMRYGDTWRGRLTIPVNKKDTYDANDITFTWTHMKSIYTPGKRHEHGMIKRRTQVYLWGGIAQLDDPDSVISQRNDLWGLSAQPD